MIPETGPFIHPAPILLAGALLSALLRPGFPLLFCRMLAPLLALGATALAGGHAGRHAVLSWMDWRLVLGRVDDTAALFALAPAAQVLLITLYGLKRAGKAELAAAWTTAAGALGVIFSGDWLSLFCFWSLLSFAPLFLIRSGAATGVGLRAPMHAAGAVSLLVGIVLLYRDTGDLGLAAVPAHPSPLVLGLCAAMLPPLFPSPSATFFRATTTTLGIPAALHTALRIGMEERTPAAIALAALVFLALRRVFIQGLAARPEIGRACARPGRIPLRQARRLPTRCERIVNDWFERPVRLAALAARRGVTPARKPLAAASAWAMRALAPSAPHRQGDGPGPCLARVLAPLLLSALVLLLYLSR